MLEILYTAIAFVFVADFYLYWQHRALHWFFPSQHALHHKRKYVILFHPVEQISNWAIFPIGYVLGFTTFEMVPVLIWSIYFVFLSHMEKKPKTYHWFFMSARKHEGHHDKYDKNFGVLLTVWDRLMRTYE